MKALYRVFASLAILLVFPALYFMKFIRIVIELGFMDGFLDDSVSLSDMISSLSGFEFGGEGFTLTETLAQTIAPLKAPAIVTLVFLCILIAAIFGVLICSVFTNARKVNLAFSILGVVATIGTIASFNALTDVVISGTVPLGDIINAVMADSESAIAAIGAMLGLGSAVSIIGELKILQLSSAFMAVLFIFIFEAIWTVSFIAIDMDSVKTPKQAKHSKKRKNHS